MPKPKTRKYLVVVQGMASAGVQTTVYSLSMVQTTIRTVDAISELDAAGKVTIPSGATCYVALLDSVCKFKRPAVAPLEAA